MKFKVGDIVVLVGNMRAWVGIVEQVVAYDPPGEDDYDYTVRFWDSYSGGFLPSPTPTWESSLVKLGSVDRWNLGHFDGI